jgi:hypothetical protein
MSQHRQRHELFVLDLRKERLLQPHEVAFAQLNLVANPEPENGVFRRHPDGSADRLGPRCQSVTAASRR